MPVESRMQVIPAVMSSVAGEAERPRWAVSIDEGLMRRPEQRLGDDDAVAVERHGGAAVELVAQFKSLAHAPAEGIIIRSGQDSIERQALRR